MNNDITSERNVNEGYPVPVNGISLVQLTSGFVPFSRQEQSSSIGSGRPEIVDLSVRSTSENVSVSS